jgi:hypothetical protein
MQQETRYFVLLGTGNRKRGMGFICTICWRWKGAIYNKPHSLNLYANEPFTPPPSLIHVRDGCFRVINCVIIHDSIKVLNVGESKQKIRVCNVSTSMVTRLARLLRLAWYNDAFSLKLRTQKHSQSQSIEVNSIIKQFS